MLIGHQQLSWPKANQMDDGVVVTLSNAALKLERAWACLVAAYFVFEWFVRPYIEEILRTGNYAAILSANLEDTIVPFFIYAAFLLVPGAVLFFGRTKRCVSFREKGISMGRGASILTIDAHRIVGLRVHRVASLENTATLEVENRDGGRWKYYGLEYGGLRDAAAAYAVERGYNFVETSYAPFYFRWRVFWVVAGIMVVFAAGGFLLPG